MVRMSPSGGWELKSSIPGENAFQSEVTGTSGWSGL